MNRKTLLWILLDLVLLAVFNTVFFVLGGAEHNASVWISYGFIHFSYLMLLATPLLIRKSSSSAVFGFSLYTISVVYFLAEFVIGLIFIIINSNSCKAALVIQVIVAGIYAIILLLNLIANETTADSIEKHKNEVAYLKNATTKIKLLLGKATGKKANKAIENVYDLLHSSPAKTDGSVQTLEVEILNLIVDLQHSIPGKSDEEIQLICDKITALVEERNRQLKTLN